MDLGHYIFREVSPRYTSLIRDDNRQPIILVQNFYRFERVRVNLKARRMVNITNLFRDRSVAIDEHCRTLHATRLSRKYSLRFSQSWRASTAPANFPTLPQL